MDPGHDPDQRRGPADPGLPDPGRAAPAALIALAVAAALIIGAALGLTTWYAAQLHDQVGQLHGQLCAYETAARELAAQLTAEGIPVRAPAAAHCP